MKCPWCGGSGEDRSDGMVTDCGGCQGTGVAHDFLRRTCSSCGKTFLCEACQPEHGCPEDRFGTLPLTDAEMDAMTRHLHSGMWDERVTRAIRELRYLRKERAQVMPIIQTIRDRGGFAFANETSDDVLTMLGGLLHKFDQWVAFSASTRENEKKR